MIHIFHLKNRNNLLFLPELDYFKARAENYFKSWISFITFIHTYHDTLQKPVVLLWEDDEEDIKSLAISFVCHSDWTWLVKVGWEAEEVVAKLSLFFFFVVCVCSQNHFHSPCWCRILDLVFIEKMNDEINLL